MADPLSLVASAVGIGASLFGGSKSPDSPAPPPTGPDTATAQAEAARRRAVASSGRQSTLLVDDTETPVGQQVPSQNIGRKTLLGS